MTAALAPVRTGAIATTMAARRLLSRRAQRWLLVVHACGAVGWIAVIAAVVALNAALILWPVAAAALDALDRLQLALTRWVLLPSVFACLATGVRLSRIYSAPWPGWLRAKIVLTGVVLALGGVVLVGRISLPGALLTARSTGLLILTIILVLSVARPGKRRRNVPRIVAAAPTAARPRPSTGKGRHRK